MCLFLGQICAPNQACIETTPGLGQSLPDLNETDVGWAPYRDRWVASREDAKERNYLDMLFDKYVPFVFDYWKRSMKPIVPAGALLADEGATPALVHANSSITSLVPPRRSVHPLWVKWKWEVGGLIEIEEIMLVGIFVGCASLCFEHFESTGGERNHKQNAGNGTAGTLRWLAGLPR